ncbi:GLPGLI family protein [Nonlabens agnitus]|uniref:GLPGLI family protein n=1 Tax=Nonlabens agnitus TaxID=870484 RepID=A0A2S9WV51_9FLAO|nr:GLPGLI family protein [Nonlabens agnitus]PRP67339.1 hypothetical protein BST86_09645 [Nonlabens agnitus]
MRFTISIIFVFSFNLLCYSQLQIEYSVKYFTKKRVDSEKNENYRNLLEPSVKVLNSSSGILNVCDNQSYFSIIPENGADLANVVLAKVLIENSSWLSSADESGNVDRRFKRLVVADYNTNKWKIGNEAKIIAGYSCLKATKKLSFTEYPNLDRDLEVWFTPDIAVDSGLRDAIGLPGLILYYNDQQWEFVASEIIEKDNCNITLPINEKISFTESNKEASKRLKDKRSRSRNNN